MKFIKYLLVFLLVLILISLVIISYPKTKETCITSEEERTVRGNSLSGLIEEGQAVTILFGYYNCNDIQRNDLVIYDFAGNKAPIIKSVQGVPGDRFSLQETKAGWNLVINNKVLLNSENQPYIFAESGYQMLSLYEQDYQGTIPESTYILLGNSPGGSLDSTRFGLVNKKDILGKAILR